MRTHLLAFVLAMTFSSIGFAREPVRAWTDATGAPLATAELVSAGENVVTLKDAAGNLIIISRPRLSAADLDYVAKSGLSAEKSKRPQGGDAPREEQVTTKPHGKDAAPLRELAARRAAALERGATKESEMAVAGALGWLARHQMPQGNWSLAGFPTRCSGPACSAPGSEKQDVGATAMALLPFLAAGQTHSSKGPYQKNIFNGIYWLKKQQKPDGDLRGGGSMYSHGLATIALCEAYGLSGDKNVGVAAQKAVNFVQMAQNTNTGGWRYAPGDAGDTSVMGWQLAALKSAKMANLQVNPAVLEKSKLFLKACAKGPKGEQFSYEPGGGGTPAMTAVGLLCTQYLGTKQADPLMTDGAAYLMANSPDTKMRNTYYWYYATQVMHNVSGKQWEAWDRAMQKILIDSQDKEGCAAGSWDPDKPRPDPWGRIGGRILTTAFSALTLEVYYRYPGVYEGE